MIDISTGWRQVRIFTSDFSQDWYFGLLRKFCVPLVEQHPDLYFWFSRYLCPLEVDKDDCHPTLIPANFLQNGIQASIRIRFRGLDETFFGEPSDKFFWSDIRDYDAEFYLGSGFGRFCAKDYKGTQRVSLVSHVLCANSRLVLDSFGDDGFETSDFDYNSINKSYFTSMHHMANNIYGVGFEPIHLYTSSAPLNQHPQIQRL